ncbi:DedA family protein [Limosilactobacillus sp. STM2_1]|uniref:DedA family protein n=1 Tax=Limosilactobacillus rudii TaxID=2759755 RepID=A0A7W3YNK5_9LACO|nr:DedA family protein [Limosilactobacillus rudii]MBB1079366.1 DedA family protein [Limosilactobacillus rudii]MBB1097412.1 DedA family protein [Limosilactobacillus rudii]MCD7134521.1 DedA family protein [Limosilactobacillus rudii]
MNAWITDFINQFGYLAIAFLIALENVFPPLPSEIILTMSGFMTTTTSLSLIGVIIAATIGSLIGALILYVIGRQLTISRLERLLSHRLFKTLGFHQSDAQHAVNWFNRHGTGGILYGRCIPVIRSLISIPAGIAQTPLGKFCLLTTIGSAIWNTILVILGSIVGKSWNKIVIIFDEYTTVAIVIMAIAFLYLAYRWYQKRIKK